MTNTDDEYITFNPNNITGVQIQKQKQTNMDTIQVVQSQTKGKEIKEEIKYDEKMLIDQLNETGKKALDKFKQNGKFPLLQDVGINPVKDILNYPKVPFFKFKKKKTLAFFATLIYFGFENEKIQEFYDLMIVKWKNDLLHGINEQKHSNLLYRILMGIIKDDDFEFEDFQSYGSKILDDIFYKFDVLDIILKNTKESKKNEKKEKIDKIEIKQILLLYVNSPKFTSFNEEDIQRLYCFFDSYYQKIGQEQKASQIKQLIFQIIGLSKIEQNYLKKYIEDYSQFQCDQQKDLMLFFKEQAKTQRYLVQQNHELKKQLSEQEDLYRSYLQQQDQNQQQQINNQSFHRNNNASQNFQQSNLMYQSQQPNLSRPNFQPQSKLVQKNTSNDRSQSNFQSNDQKKSSNEILVNKQNSISNKSALYENNHNGILHVPDLNKEELAESYNCFQNPSIQLSCTHQICSKCVFHDYLQKKIGLDIFQMFDLQEEIFNNRKIQCVKKDCKTLITYKEFKKLVDINKVEFGMI
ncbi:hypothetical protein PPERSA_12405 [Pseudocohnilembus persalinus]|uniref:Uncharacterized protein n=1 Tax=Pseudocohnilembus persalinus TaxID=266149 RepID=A0A0V0QNW6_PSEPJ|nr:hypothetical protein PPERSA_12405 [Pseudocohnilembus persalinus]|eukprot:KRX03958.1 hypothetical protein PPERSA_12405 [Pseudocohnilembus persalinus]